MPGTRGLGDFNISAFHFHDWL